MRRLFPICAGAALLPAMLGPLPARAQEPGGIVLTLCQGGVIVVPSGNGDAPAGMPGPGSQGPCCAKGCHAGDRRRPIDREQ